MFYSSFKAITVLVASIYLIACLTFLVSPVHFWPLVFLSLLFPYVFLLFVFICCIWLFLKKKTVLILLPILLSGIPNLTGIIAVKGLFTKKQDNVNRKNLRILTWNVQGFGNPSFHADTINGTRAGMFAFIKQSGADVLCLQEFAEHVGQGMFSNTRELAKLGYMYYYKTNEQHHAIGSAFVFTGTAIFSKKPFFYSGKYLLGDSSYPEHLAFIDVKHHNKPVRIYSTHFKSINLFAEPKDTIYNVLFHGDRKLVYESTKWQKLKIFGQEHAKQAIMSKRFLNKSPYAFIMGADLNSVPPSYAYFTLRQGLADAFLQHGAGVGDTFNGVPIPLRIDYLFAHPKLQIIAYHKDTITYSDHYPQWIDVSWK